ncbi:MAG: hypothetical protein HQL11_00365 [Candidatus Omnitrophica bacterium]|nr:hypothetical protein [Candidatus Omnitrophota bacterium]
MPPVKEKTCVNPWFGYLALMLICVLMAGGVFLQFGGSKLMPKERASRGAQAAPAHGGGHMMTVAFTPGGITQKDGVETIVF